MLGVLLASIATVLKRAGIKPQSVSAAVRDGANTADDVGIKMASTNSKARSNCWPRGKGSGFVALTKG
jgi:hypothetical protein